VSLENEIIQIEFDGGSRGNPGPAGIGVVLRAADGTPLVTIGRFIGRATNNVAEYKAMIAGLEEARKLGARRIRVKGDSELIVRQMQGVYRVKNADLRELYEEAQHLIGQFDKYTIDHSLREKNKLADRLANIAMDRRAEVTEVPEESAGGADNESSDSVAAKAGDRLSCPRCGCAIQVTSPSRLYPHQLRPFVCQCGARMGR
jgi:ribonuclease HI